MRLLFQQKFFSWFDSYNVFDEQGDKVYAVKGQLAWGHKLKVYDRSGQEVGELRQVILTLLPRFEIYIQGQYMGSISRELSLFRPRYHIDFNGWRVEGDMLEWDYRILDRQGVVAVISKQLLRLTDTYVIDVARPQDGLYALMFVLAVDAEKCSRKN